MRFRQMYPMFTRKTNRRILNLADTSSDNSSSDEEPITPSSNRSVRRNSEPASAPGPTLPLPSPMSVPTAPNVSSTNASNDNSSVSASSNNGTVRNFNTELEQLVTSLLNEIERNEGESNRSSNETSLTNQANNTSEGKFGTIFIIIIQFFVDSNMKNDRVKFCC